MGINSHTLNLLFRLQEKFEMNSICLLGNLYLREDTKEILKDKYEKVALEYFKKEGFKDVISFDINEKDGSLPVDLSKSIPEKYKNRFDLVLNGGTAEHVSNQKMVFQNMHDLCVKKGIIFNLGPMEGSWPVHSKYHYSFNFFKNMANERDYEILHMSKYYMSGEKRGWNVCVIFRK